MTPRLAHITALRNLRRDLEGCPDHETDAPSTSASYLRSFVERAIQTPDDFPIDKLARWTGFVQGVMAVRGWISVEAERDRTRPLFTAYET